MKKLLTLAIILLAMQSCTKDDPEPEPQQEQRHDRKEVYDRVDMEKVRK